MNKIRKTLFFTIIVFLLTIFAFSNQVYAVDDGFNTAPGELKIPFEKKWQDVSVEQFPDYINIKLYKYIGDVFDEKTAILLETRTLTSENNWKYEFDISKEPLIDSNGLHYNFKVVEEMPLGFEEITRNDPIVNFSPPMAGDYDILSSNSLTNIPLSQIGGNTATIVAATMTSEDKSKFICGPNGNQQCDVIIWTQTQLSPAERVLIARFVSKTGANFKKASYELNEDGTIKSNTVYFISGDGALGGMTVGTDVDGIDKVMFDTTSKWSHVLTGVYTPSRANSIASSITNTLKRTNLIVEKKWDDHNNILGLRPNSVTIQLLKNGGVVDSVKLSASNNWKYEFKDLVEYDNGIKNIYTINEITVNGYTSSQLKSGSSIIITNTHEVKPTEVNVEKIWKNTGQIAKLPGVKVALYYKVSEDDTPKEIAQAILSEANNWKYTFTRGDGKFDILPEDYIYIIKEIGFDVSESEKSFYDEYFDTKYTQKGNDWVITNICKVTYVLPETGSNNNLVILVLSVILLGTPSIYLVYSFIKKDI